MFYEALNGSYLQEEGLVTSSIFVEFLIEERKKHTKGHKKIDVCNYSDVKKGIFSELSFSCTNAKYYL